MYVHDDSHTTAISIEEVSINELKQILLRATRYVDANYDLGEAEAPEQAYNILDRVCSDMHEFAMCEPGMDRDRVWQKPREIIQLLKTTGMSVLAGEERGVACVRIVSSAVDYADFRRALEVEVPHEGERLLPSVEPWPDSVCGY